MAVECACENFAIEKFATVGEDVTAGDESEVHKTSKDDSDFTVIVLYDYDVLMTARDDHDIHMTSRGF